MILLFKLILLTSMIVLALKIAMSEDMLLEGLGKWFKKKIDEGHKWLEMFYCQWCMATFYSLIAHAFAFGLNILPLEFNWQLLIRWPLVVFGASFLSGNLWNLYETTNRIKDRNDAEENFYNLSIEDMIERNDIEDEYDEEEDKKKFLERLKN